MKELSTNFSRSRNEKSKKYDGEFMFDYFETNNRSSNELNWNGVSEQDARDQIASSYSYEQNRETHSTQHNLRKDFSLIFVYD